MNRFLLPLVGFAAVTLVLGVGLFKSDQKGTITSPLLGKNAPTFRLPSLTDSNVLVDDKSLVSGDWHLVNVWGTWCEGCRTEHEALLQIKAEGRVPIIGIDWKDSDSDAITWLARLGNPYAMIGADRDGRVAIDWGVYGAPESFLVNPQGVVVEKQTGIMTSEIWNKRFLPHLNAASAKP